MVKHCMLFSIKHKQQKAGAAPGCLLRGGGGQNVSLLLREPQIFAPALTKSLGGGGGDSNKIFFPTSKNFQKIFHNGVGYYRGHDRPLGWQAKKKEKQKRKIIGGHLPAPLPPPPSWRRHWHKVAPGFIPPSLTTCLIPNRLHSDPPAASMQRSWRE